MKKERHNSLKKGEWLTVLSTIGRLRAMRPGEKAF